MYVYKRLHQRIDEDHDSRDDYTLYFVKREEGSGEDSNLEFDAAKQNTGNASRLRQHSFDGSRVSSLFSLPLSHNNSTTGFLSIFHAQILL